MYETDISSCMRERSQERERYYERERCEERYRVYERKISRVKEMSSV